MFTIFAAGLMGVVLLLSGCQTFDRNEIAKKVLDVRAKKVEELAAVRQFADGSVIMRYEVASGVQEADRRKLTRMALDVAMPARHDQDDVERARAFLQSLTESLRKVQDVVGYDELRKFRREHAKELRALDPGAVSMAVAEGVKAKALVMADVKFKGDGVGRVILRYYEVPTSRLLVTATFDFQKAVGSDEATNSMVALIRPPR